MLRNLFSRRRTPKLILKPTDDLQQLNYVLHDVRVFQAITQPQKQELLPIRNKLINKATKVSSTIAKLKALEDATDDEIELIQSKAIKERLSNLSEIDSNHPSPYAKKTKRWGIFQWIMKSKSASGKDSVNTANLEEIQQRFTKVSPLLSSQHMQMILRLQLCKEYFAMLHGLLEKSEISPEALKENSKVLRLLDAVLMGSSSERIAEHMSLFGTQFYQYTMQSCFYSLYEAEIQALTKHLDKYPLCIKRHTKLLTKHTGGTYLLDVLELSTKLRSVLAWMGKCDSLFY